MANGKAAAAGVAGFAALLVGARVAMEVLSTGALKVAQDVGRVMERIPETLGATGQSLSRIPSRLPQVVTDFKASLSPLAASTGAKSVAPVEAVAGAGERSFAGLSKGLTGSSSASSRITALQQALGRMKPGTFTELSQGSAGAIERGATARLSGNLEGAFGPGRSAYLELLAKATAPARGGAMDAAAASMVEAEIPILGRLAAERTTLTVDRVSEIIRSEVGQTLETLAARPGSGVRFEVISGKLTFDASRTVGGLTVKGGETNLYKLAAFVAGGIATCASLNSILFDDCVRAALKEFAKAVANEVNPAPSAVAAPAGSKEARSTGEADER